MIKPLPKWVLTENYPAFYDTETVTAIEMVAKVYGSMQELIDDYNKFVDDINKAILDFESEVNGDINDFKEYIEGIINDFIATVNGKIAEQDGVIADAVNYMKTNLVSNVTALYEEGFAQGAYTSQVGITYVSDDEELLVEDTLVHAETEEF